jgi:hypothetical protein
MDIKGEPPPYSPNSTGYTANGEPSPILLDGYSRNDTTSLSVRCHDPTFRSVTILDDATGDTLFTVAGKGASSLSVRRTVLNDSGRKMFDLRHMAYAMKNEWAVEDESGGRICTLKRGKGYMFDLKGTIHHKEGGQDASEPHFRTAIKDWHERTTSIFHGSQELAIVKNEQSNDVMNLEKKGLDRSVWKVTIAPRTDISLVSAVDFVEIDQEMLAHFALQIIVATLCVAEIEHFWRCYSGENTKVIFV